MELVSVAHYDLPTELLYNDEVSASGNREPTYTQNGDAMRDPEIFFIVSKLGLWTPMSFQQDNLGIYQEAVSIRDGSFFMNAALIRDLQDFARMWDRNIAAQGYLEASKSIG